MKYQLPAKSASLDILGLTAGATAIELLNSGMVNAAIVAAVFCVALVVSKHFVQHTHNCKK